MEKKKGIDEEIDNVVAALGKMDPSSGQYEIAAKNLETLCRAKSYKSSSTVSADTLVGVAANLLGIVMILNYEQLHVVGSKTLNLLFKSRV